MRRTFFLVLSILLLFAMLTKVQAQESVQPIDAETLQKWSAPYRGWQYHPSPIIPSDYKIPGLEDFHSYDCPCVYQLKDKPDIWYMAFIG
ncbi:MAG: hypothetical protein LBC74_12420, partial [Planctomycetaceae bacterium]|nr:hypothetical protein [Planctomycetaceae bacterium]